MATKIWVDIGTNDDLYPDDTKPLPEPVLIYHQYQPRAISQEVHMNIICKLFED